MIIRPYTIAGRGAVFVGWAKPDRSSLRRKAPHSDFSRIPPSEAKTGARRHPNTSSFRA
ncbi:MAG: hypothetical protein LBS70_00230 [Candidatus Accumulibacter sp.]|nr:hypothetical protein [Accumulibacter sp.]